MITPIISSPIITAFSLLIQYTNEQIFIFHLKVLFSLIYQPIVALQSLCAVNLYP